MKLNHLNLSVERLEEARDFFRDLFGFRLADQKGDAIAVMEDGHGFTLVLSRAAAFGENAGEEAKPAYPKDFHLGFYVETNEEVDRMREKLELAGLVAAGERPRRMRGGYSLYFAALGGLLFEVTSFEG